MQSMTWYEVDATGMHELYPEVCNEDIFYPHAHFSDTCNIRRGQTLYSSTAWAFPTASNDRRVEVEAHVFCCVVMI